MDQNEILRVSVENVRQLISNGLLLLKDVDAQLAQAGFVPVNGSKIGSESSDDIRQTAGQPVTFLPQYMCRYYSRPADVTGKLLAVNVQLYHYAYDRVVPSIIAAGCNRKNANTPLEYGWLQSCVFDSDQPFYDDGTVFAYEDEVAEARYWALPLSSFQRSEDVQREAVAKLLEWYEQ
ncbi:hypothetical protein [Paenibacillus sp. NPDC058071]|uniref:hypothetical protein n=1 Tax=Paenibacillus sp. NPDC058071 TaxID=3346326 RepID=UPI0036DD816F